MVDLKAMRRTRIKFCGLTDLSDLQNAVSLGVDFIGFVFYEKSPRLISVDEAAILRRNLPSYVQAVGLFVNLSKEQINEANKSIGLDVLQFHGDETSVHCQDIFNLCKRTGNTRAFWQALRLKSVDDLLPWTKRSDLNATVMPEGLLLDSFSPQFGGSGHGFDWSWVEEGSSHRPTHIPLIASGGLNSNNVSQAIGKIKPFAVDVSSGIQTSDPRRKDVSLMERFVEQVIKADASLL
jgi:phosphoribosylanthranilate isomerase